MKRRGLRRAIEAMTTPTPEARRVAAEVVRPFFIGPNEFTDGGWCVDVCGHAFFDPEPRQEDAEFIAEAIRERFATAFTRAAEEAREEERAWWLAACEEDFPCVTAGAPRGSCKHESFISCLLDAAALRQAGKK